MSWHLNTCHLDFFLFLPRLSLLVVFEMKINPGKIIEQGVTDRIRRRVCTILRLQFVTGDRPRGSLTDIPGRLENALIVGKGIAFSHYWRSRASVVTWFTEFERSGLVGMDIK